MTDSQHRDPSEKESIDYSVTQPYYDRQARYRRRVIYVERAGGDPTPRIRGIQFKNDEAARTFNLKSPNLGEPPDIDRAPIPKKFETWDDAEEWLIDQP